MFLTLFAYVRFLEAKQDEIAWYEGEKIRLEGMQNDLRIEMEDLALQIRSQQDPAWVEMVLLRELGVVPEGWLKVHFAP